MVIHNFHRVAPRIDRATVIFGANSFEELSYKLVPLIGLLALLVYTFVYTNELIELKMNELKIRKVGNSLAVTVPVNIASQMKVSEGDAVYLTELPGGGFRITPHDPELVEQMKTIEGLSKRYRNTLKALSE